MIYPDDATSLFTTSGFSNMSDRRPDTDISTNKEFNVIKFESEGGYEKRRLRHRRAVRSYDLTYTNVTGLERYAIEQFYNTHGGEYLSFDFNLDHISENSQSTTNQNGYVRVRFDGPLDITHVNSYGDNVLQKFYTVSFKLKETFS